MGADAAVEPATTTVAVVLHIAETTWKHTETIQNCLFQLVQHDSIHMLLLVSAVIRPGLL